MSDLESERIWHRSDVEERLHAQITTLQREVESLRGERDQWKRFADDRSESDVQQRLNEEIKIVDRVWRALGITGYEQAKPLAIDEHVARTIKERDQARAALQKAKVALEYAQEGLYVFKGPGETGIPKIQDALAAIEECGL